MGNRRKQQRALARAKREGKLNEFLKTIPMPGNVIGIDVDRYEKGLPAGFEKGGPSDSDERAAGQRHIQSRDISKTVRVPDGEWVDIRVGQVVAEGTYLDDEGVLRSTGDNSCVVWHNKGGGCGPSRVFGEYRKKILASEIIYDENGAPWCPQCVADNQRKKIIDKQLAEKAKSLFEPTIFKSKGQENRFYGRGRPKLTNSMSEARRQELEKKFPVLTQRVTKRGK